VGGYDSALQGHVARFLVGPTATGKSAVAQWIAEREGFEILSADSMLVYRGMDIGTAKPTPEERGRVRYWGVDVVSAGEPFNVARFLEEARRCFESAHARGMKVLVVGGTGLYIKALVDGLAGVPAADESARAGRRAVLEELGVEGLQRELRSRNPAWYAALPDPANSRRLIRALELIESGWERPPATWRGADGKPGLVGLSMVRGQLRERIAARVATMYAQGLLDETRGLLAEGFGASPTARQAVGYAEAIACVEGKVSRELAIERTVQRTRQLAKRQMTWFRHQVAVQWIDVGPSQPVEEVAARVRAEWEKLGATPVVV
jgi:tRNA dimethylallyltransferase